MRIGSEDMPGIIKNFDRIDLITRGLISQRYHKITKVINQEFWNSNSDQLHSLYVGSYGRGSAISTSDIDILVELPSDEYYHYDRLKGNGQSRLLQAVKNCILTSYSRSSIHGDGQVVVIQFSDGIKFELLPAFKEIDYWGNVSYVYPDSNMGGNWKSTNPKKEQEAMREKNSINQSNGLLFDTCKYIRYVRDKYFSSYHLSGIVIDSFVYQTIGMWHWCRNGETGRGSNETFENVLIHSFNILTMNGMYAPTLYAPGSNMAIDSSNSYICLGKVLNKIVKG
jgi:hypothetical protein